MSNSRVFSAEDVAQHNKPDDCWIIVEGKVFDVTKFLSNHPGGRKVLLAQAGKDATTQFRQFHRPEVLNKYGDLQIGVAGGAPSAPAAPKESSPSPRPAAPKPTPTPTPAPAQARTSTAVARAAGDRFGDGLPFGDPSWYQDWNSPYYNDSHRRLRGAMRAFVEKEIAPFVHEWDEAGRLPKELFKKAGDAGFLSAVIGPPWPTEYAGSKIIGDIPPESFDAFHEFIVIDELARVGSGGVIWGLIAGLSIGLPPVMQFGTKLLRDRVARDCLSGQKIICLAITEPTAGSDVANLKCEAKKTPDGRHYIVNGEKKWITNGVFADYFTVAVRTGGPGAGGVSLLLIDRSMGGVHTKQMKCSGVWPSGTTYITFEDTRVPVENLIGQENQGFKLIMQNFNHERWSVAVEANRFARVCLEEAIKFALQRKTFGQRLIDHAVIRFKLANMIRQVEATHSWLENITYQMTTLPKEVAREVLGSQCMLVKAQSTITFEYCAREAGQIFGGLAFTRGGLGEKVERLSRETRAFSVPAGSEEIMLLNGFKLALGSYERKSKL